MLPEIIKLLQDKGMPQSMIEVLSSGVSLIAVMIVALLALWAVRIFFTPAMERLLEKTSFKWDDLFVLHGFFPALSRLVPLVVIYVASDLFFTEHPLLAEILKRGAMTLLVLAGTKCLAILLNVAKDIYSAHKTSRNIHIASYIGAFRIIIYIFAGICVVGILTNKSPWGVFSVLGGLTAVLILVFKDTILGFVASLQLSGNDMVRVGDWLEMPKYHADGDVIDVSIHTVKVRNWDKTITTIPTYALVSDAFKNWRGMSESGGRRIKRSLLIDMNSIGFCTADMLEKFSQLALLKDYLYEKQGEIAAYNARLGLADSAVPNGRSQTNIGVFRAYVKSYLLNHPKIHQEMTFLVRHLAPTAKGLPIEIYVFSNDQVWANYEAIQADIFDHILAIVPYFNLRVFQEPSGADFSKLAGMTLSQAEQGGVLN